MTNHIRILFIDDHALFRESAVRLLESEPELDVVGHCATLGEANRIVATTPVDVVLLDYDLGKEVGTDFLSTLQQNGNSAKVLMVTAGMQTSDLRKTIMECNAGIFLKTEPTTELIAAIQRTAKGERWISSGAALTLLSAENRLQGEKSLTSRESIVLRGVLEGLSNKEIGHRLNVTESSVKAVLQKLFEKTGVRSRSQLVRYAIETQIELS